MSQHDKRREDVSTRMPDIMGLCNIKPVEGKRRNARGGGLECVHKVYLCVNDSYVYWRVCGNVRLSVCLSVRLSVCLSVYLSVYLSVSLSAFLSVFRNSCMSICLSVCLPVFLNACLSIYLSVCLPAFFNASLSVCLSAHVLVSTFACAPATGLVVAR